MGTSTQSNKGPACGSFLESPVNILPKTSCIKVNAVQVKNM